MEQNKFFLWISRTASILFLLLIVVAIGFLFYGFSESKRWSNRNTVEITEEKPTTETVKNLKLSNITKVCGKDIQYVKLSSGSNSKGFSSSSYRQSTRNVIFFVGEEMNSHWLYNTDNHLINKIVQLKTKAHNCKDKETTAIYYETVKNDTNQDGKLNIEDEITISITSPDGKNYTELDTAITSVIDHSIDKDAKTLTILIQKEGSIIMKKFSLTNNQKISERKISRIGKKS